MIKRHPGWSLETLLFHFPSKKDLAIELIHTVTRRVQQEFIPSDIPKDILFDLILLRIEGLSAYKPAVRQMIEDRYLWPLFCTILHKQFTDYIKGLWGSVAFVLYILVFMYALSHTEEETMIFLDQCLDFLLKNFKNVHNR